MSKSILIVDDEKDVSESLRIGLERHGFKVRTYNDPTQVVKDFARAKYDLVILDIRMPQMSGFDLFRRLKVVDPDARICFLTAFDMYKEEFQKLFPTLQVAGFLRKPISISELAAEVAKMTAKMTADSYFDHEHRTTTLSTIGPHRFPWNNLRRMPGFFVPTTIRSIPSFFASFAASSATDSVATTTFDLARTPLVSATRSSLDTQVLPVSVAASANSS